MHSILVRLPVRLHRAARVAAATRGFSVNRWIVRLIEQALRREGRCHPSGPVAALLRSAAKEGKR